VRLDAVRDNPISQAGCGLKLTRNPRNRVFGTTRSFSICPAMKLKSQGPIQLSHFVLNASVRLRSIVNAGMGRALFDRIWLPSQPGPHQRSIVLAAMEILPSSSAMRLPSGRTSSPSAGSSTPVTLRLTVRWSPNQE
jgi:hypothetical protein